MPLAHALPWVWEWKDPRTEEIRVILLGGTDWAGPPWDSARQRGCWCSRSSDSLWKLLAEQEVIPGGLDLFGVLQRRLLLPWGCRLGGRQRFYYSFSLFFFISCLVGGCWPLSGWRWLCLPWGLEPRGDRGWERGAIPRERVALWAGRASPGEISPSSLPITGSWEHKP